MNIDGFHSIFSDEDACSRYLEKSIWHQDRDFPQCNSSTLGHY